MTRDPFEKLRSEHRLLARVVDAFEVFLDTSHGDPDQQAADFTTFAHFFRDVADRGHHEKEERALDPFLVQCGFDWESGPLSQVRDYHDRERKLIRLLQQAASDGWPPDPPSRKRVTEAARDLIASQRTHIRLEDTLVFPIADRKLDAREHEALAREMAEYERTQGNAEALRDTLHGIERLCQRYVPAAPSDG